MSEIAERLQAVRARIAAAAEKSGRPPSAVTLLAVTKTMPVARIQEALAAGARLFGENRIQEAREKIPQILGAAWHLVGHLQTNKAKQAVELFECIHSVDSVRLAQEVSRHAMAGGKRIRCLIEVNLGEEPQKSGAAADEVRQLCKVVRELPGVALEGLMTVPPFLPDPEATRPFFRRLRELRDRMVDEGGHALPELSMGMTNDFEVAIAEGATVVRIGTAIFGARPAGG
ncbi:MAG TPA: YggS family pyridoxal phosphate-dependent enzyme [Rectinemataceae bacterium]|nr:YggS family pyridoxal phosphate-dependent enzyme [Rectinemataceae bacterium]